MTGSVAGTGKGQQVHLGGRKRTLEAGSHGLNNLGKTRRGGGLRRNEELNDLAFY